MNPCHRAFRSKLFSIKWQRLTASQQKHSKFMSIIIFGLMLLSPAVPVFVLYTISLQTLRRYMQTADSSAWGDNQWGFGQILAPLLWGPVVLQLIDCLLMDEPREEAAKRFGVKKTATTARPRATPILGSVQGNSTAVTQTTPAIARSGSNSQPPPPAYTAAVPTSPVIVPSSPLSPSVTQVATQGPSPTQHQQTNHDTTIGTAAAQSSAMTASATSSSTLQPQNAATEGDPGLVGSFRKRTTFDSTTGDDTDDGPNAAVATASVVDQSARVVTGEASRRAL